METTDANDETLLKNISFSLSGRTALLQIIDDIIAERTVRCVHLPSYCCESVIDPFHKRGIRVEFYEVTAEAEGVAYQINRASDKDIILVANYFGLGTEQTKNMELELRNRCPGSVIIRDITHSLFSAHGIDGAYDYMFASIRKWSGFSDGGIASRSKGSSMRQYEKIHHIYLNKIDEAKRLKREYILGKSNDKSFFLKLFSEAEQVLDEDYAEYAISEQSYHELQHFDIDVAASKRRQNYVKILENAETLREKGIFPLFNQLRDEEVPLFFPVVFNDKNERDRFRSYLIRNDVYCPIHWPVSPLHDLNERTRKIYDTELSLICDQRYDSDDMERVVDLIRKY